MTLEDPELLRRFEAASIPSDAWTHREHLRVIFLYLRDHPFPIALQKMREGVQTLNRANAVPEGETSGYHETITVAWARIVAAGAQEMGSGSTSEELLERHPELLDKALLRNHYSRERIRCWEAKRGFVEPDLRPLPVPW